MQDEVLVGTTIAHARRSLRAALGDPSDASDEDGELTEIMSPFADVSEVNEMGIPLGLLEAPQGPMEMEP